MRHSEDGVATAAGVATTATAIAVVLIAVPFVVAVTV